LSVVLLGTTFVNRQMLSFVVQYFDELFYMHILLCLQVFSSYTFLFAFNYYMIQMIIDAKCNAEIFKGIYQTKYDWISHSFFSYYRHYALILTHRCNVWRNNIWVHLCRNDSKGNTLSYPSSFLFFFLMNNLIRRCASSFSLCPLCAPHLLCK